MPTTTTNTVSAPDEVCQTDPIDAPREVCPTWCVDRDQPGGCDGMHWTAGGGVVPTLGRIAHPLAVKILSVYLHQDREWAGLDRDPDEMDAEPHVLLHVFGGAGGALDCDARMTAGEARQLARLLLGAAADLDGDADTSGVTVTDIDRAARALGLKCSDLFRLAEVGSIEAWQQRSSVRPS